MSDQLDGWSDMFIGQSANKTAVLNSSLVCTLVRILHSLQAYFIT